MSDRLKATDIIRTYAWLFPQYQTLIDDMATLGLKEDQGRLVVFAYDWRKANEVSAAALADVLDKLIERQGVNARITLLAHSMGGLIARYLLESGRFNDRRFLKNVARCIFLGTPHKGAPLALARILGQEKAVWLSAEQVKVAVNDSRFPSAYQLLPPPGQPFVWNESGAAGYEPVDLYDKGVAAAMGLNMESLEQARSFYSELNLSKKPEKVRYFCFNGTQHRTAVFSAADKAVGPRIGTRKIEREDSGDGIVPVWSSILEGVQSFTVGGEHSVIYQDKSLRRLLSALMGHPGKLGQVELTRGVGAKPGVEISIRDKFVEVEADLHFVVGQLRSGLKIDGELRVERMPEDGAEKTTGEVIGEPMKFRYAMGPSLESIAFKTTAPSEPGIYRIVYYPRGSKKSAGAGVRGCNILRSDRNRACSNPNDQVVAR
jgi:pimeloyl-ACP methyl ester carboxylesterase